jgi:hypothetical protein
LKPDNLCGIFMSSAQPADLKINLKSKEYRMDTNRKQNLPMGVAAGVGAAIIGAVIWALITVATNYQIGWMAVGVGFLVGYAIRFFGRGVDQIFGIAGAIIALLGCLTGNLLTDVIIIAQQEGMQVMTVLSRLNPGIIVNLLTETFQPMDLLFYGIAVYEAYKFSFLPAEEAPVAAQPETE